MTQPTTTIDRAFDNKKTKADGAPVERNSHVPGTVDSSLARVGVEVGCTLNIGNYESVRYAVRIELPCAPADVRATQEEAQAIAQDVYEREIEKIREFVVESRIKAQQRINTPAGAKPW